MHYHGTPISPRTVLHTLAGRHFCVSYADHRDVETCHQIGQSVMLDNGAYSVWKRGHTVDWDAWAEWATHWLEFPTTWAVLPDVIDGDEEANDELLARFSLMNRQKVAPVWHLHESLDRLGQLVMDYDRVCFGSSGAFARVGSPAWHRRISEAFDGIADPDGRVPWIHMLRGMSLSGGPYPFASVDSTDIGQNHNRPQNTAREMADRWDALQCPARWERVDQLALTVTG